MIPAQSIGSPLVVTVDETEYVVKVGSGSTRPSKGQAPAWYVVAFARDLDWQRHVPLAGPFESEAKASEALVRYLTQSSYAAMAHDKIARANQESI